MYILKCADGSYYTGSTIDLETRFREHESGSGANHTANRLPVEQVYWEEFERVEDAFKREKQIQRWTRAKMEALIQAEYGKLKKLAACKNSSHFSNRGFDFVHPPEHESAHPPEHGENSNSNE